MIRYLDTSLLVGTLTREQRTPQLQDWLSAQPPEELAISDWVITEFSGALSVKTRMGQLPPEKRAESLAVFNSLVERTFEVLPVSRLAFQTAARFADQHETGLRSGDALHLAVAAQEGRRLTALDERLVEAGQNLGVSAELL